MKTVTILLRSTFVLLIIYLSACEKIIDFNKAKNCRIEKIHFFKNEGYDLDFYYNKWGNPDSIIFNPSQGENFNLYFIYNNKKQLIALREAFGYGFTVLLHRFGYSRGVITTDSAVSFYTQIPFHHTTYFEYDQHGRMSKSTFVPRGTPPEYATTFTYKYDTEGNLIRPNQTITYDNKINLQQLHPIWLFLARDYSVNNPVTAINYNNFGLPTKFDVPPPPVFSIIFPFLGNNLNELANSEITYECK